MNQNAEQHARDKQMNLTAGLGVASKEYSTDVGPADCVLFADKKRGGIIEAKREEEGVRL